MHNVVPWCVHAAILCIVQARGGFASANIEDITDQVLINIIV